MIPPVQPHEQGARTISPTDISQFIRLDQCERYLRLRLHERAVGQRFMRSYGVTPQSIPPLLTGSGARFEQLVEQAVAARWPTHDCAAGQTAVGERGYDNELVVDRAQALEPGQTSVLFQPRLQVALDGWLLRGDVDILRLERDADGGLHLLIADMKSSTTARVEHRLQVAFYYEMIAALFASQGLAYASLNMAILYRGPTDDLAALAPQERAALEQQRQAAGAYFAVEGAFLELVPDPESYRASVHDLVTGPESMAVRVAQVEFEQIPFHLTYKCDGCLYNELCMKWSAEHDDLSLLPHLADHEKRALNRSGVTTMRELARLKEPRDERGADLVPAPDKVEQVRRMGATWPIGPRLDELVHRARRYRAWKKDELSALPYIPSKGYGSLPYADAEHNPSLVRIYIDAQHDYLHDRIYLLGALVVGCEGGVPSPERRRSIVHLAPRAPETAELEQQLFVGWLRELLAAVVALAAPDAEGHLKAPIHLIFYNRFEQKLLLDGLSRHFASVLETTPLYDFLTQLAAFDSPIVSFLDQEIRELKNYPMVCQSLQAVAAYLKFDWNAGTPYRELFRTRLFDFWGRLDEEPEPDRQLSRWFTSRARFNSQLPLEYAYAAWGELPAPPTERDDDFASYRQTTPELLCGFHARRLEALEHIAQDFPGNKQTTKRDFDLSALATFSEKARTLAQSLREFSIIERHVELSAWKSARLAPPERRMLAGDTLLVRYREEDQDPALLERVRENRRRRELKERYTAEFLAGHPGRVRATLTPAQRAETILADESGPFRLRLELEGVDCELDEALGLTTIKEGERLVLNRRWEVDSRLPLEEQLPFTPTPKQMLYGSRVSLNRIVVERDAGGRARAAWAEVSLVPAFGGGGGDGFTFGSMQKPWEHQSGYSLDPDPNNIYGAWCHAVVEGLCSGEPNTLYERLVGALTPAVARPPLSHDGGEGLPSTEEMSFTPEPGDEGQQAAPPPMGGVAKPGEHGAGLNIPMSNLRHPHAGTRRASVVNHIPARADQGDRKADAQARFFAGLDALHRAGALHGFEQSKRDFIGKYGDAPILLVQGPPGTGKSYSTAFALFARLQGALAAGQGYRVVVCCKTHAATDVLLENIVACQQLLRDLRQLQPALFDEHISPHLLDIPLYRLRPQQALPPGVTGLPRDDESGALARAYETICANQWCIVAATPGGLFRMLNTRDKANLFRQTFADALVLDEASQMNLPEALMAALALKTDGQLIVVGDHRQMPPIVKHDWSSEPRRTFKEYRAFESLFETLRQRQLPMIKFEESFRLHADMAAFLREEIYRHDGIPYHSRRREVLPAPRLDDPFLARVLDPAHPLTVVVHDEAGSQLHNPFEQRLIAPLLETLADERFYGFDASTGLGVVVPHRAQRAALQQAVPQLCIVDPQTGGLLRSAVDTVERFQGDERKAILISATESDPQYLLVSSKFLLDPRRLTVALSRAKQKLILVASRSIFTLFSADEETFAHAQLWKNLLAKTCTVKLWEGQREGQRVQVWGNEGGGRRV